MSDNDSNSGQGGISVPATPNAAPTKMQLSDREQEILSKAWSCMKVQPEIDYIRLAAATGMTNHRSAANAWSALKKKLFVGTAAATPAKARAAAAANNEGGDSEKKRKRATPKKKVSTGGDGEDVDATPIETPIKKKRTPAKKKPSTTTAANEAPVSVNTAVTESEATVADMNEDEAKVEHQSGDEI
ncbi:hypothetical protein HYQ45_011260 [Verticillium longisporum]|uniref:Uncharacterized protein n=1 Tax=Verticillium longisporum TaxID=100787 RepID=A0A8I2ZGN6_VERLO|nr:hypothetical protein VdG1_06046 [Verticillium dahliae VDG1]KAG7129739.1 hypothetical protein HYQ45_011260 [Verticillium longisporum]RBQ81548.1 hypothetical protein VDGD_07757 [Verticillium dahliae]